MAATHAASRRRYRVPRVHHALVPLVPLVPQGTAVGRHHVARLVREGGLQARPRHRLVITTDGAHAEPIAPNRLARGFAVGGPPDRARVADATYVPTAEGWRSLVVIWDLATRRVVGRAAEPTLDTALFTTALARAVATRQPAPGLPHHADRGSTYAGGAY